VIEAVEEERLNRIKHTNCFPVEAMRACLRRRGVAFGDVDQISYYFTEKFADAEIQAHHQKHPECGPFVPTRDLLDELCLRYFGQKAGGRLRFVSHHLAHAASAHLLSGQAQSLVLVLDGMGDDVAGMVLSASDGRMQVLQSIPLNESLGQFYLLGLRFLGYKLFDEYKVMGLAPYGDRRRYQSLFRSFYTLLPGGQFKIHGVRALRALASLVPTPQRGQPFVTLHLDLAAALQSALEEMVFHVLRHWRDATGLRRLCLAGGVAHNCTLNGKILDSRLFDEVFVQPAAHDAGCAIGAALVTQREDCLRSRSLPHVYWGTPLDTPDEVSPILRRWEAFVRVTRRNSIIEIVADHLVNGRVVGWVQGRSEFGPRALGHRSILADPRPVANKDHVNHIVKKREAFRPFAPSVLEEEFAHYFERPPTSCALDFMTFAVRVRPDARETLGAVTHVDGTARVQTVSRVNNERFWLLIDAFRRRTNVPVLLNTSFNNHVEPIVDSVEDAVVCFLTTGLDLLVVGDFLVERREPAPEAFRALVPAVPAHVRMVHREPLRGDAVERFRLENRFSGRCVEVTEGTFRALEASEGGSLERSMVNAALGPEARRVAEQEILALWSERLVVLRP
jgi:carbamoyltransferase